MFLASKEEHRIAFFDEDIHIDLLPGKVSEVVFKPANQSSDQVVLMRAGQVVQSGHGGSLRYYVNPLGHLVLADVKEENEGTYIVKNSNDSTIVKRLILIVRGKLSVVLCLSEATVLAVVSTFLENWSSGKKQLVHNFLLDKKTETKHIH